jgi:hypothetical protein
MPFDAFQKTPALVIKMTVVAKRTGESSRMAHTSRRLKGAMRADANSAK